MSKKNGRLMTLTDATNREGSALPSISPHGNLIYVVYSDTGTISEFFQNEDGKLVYLRGLPKDPNFPDTQSGYANPKFTKFTLLDANDSTLQGRIRVVDDQYNLINQRIFDNVFNFLGGVFSPDGQHIGLTYLNPGSNPETSTLQVLDTKTLLTVASIVFNTHTNGPKFVIRNDKTYVVVASGNPSACQVYIYKLTCDNLVLLDTQPLPQFPEVTAVLNQKYDPLILVGTRAAFLQNEKGLVVDNSGFNSLLPFDGNEVRFYIFDGYKLKMVYSQNPNVSILPVDFNGRSNIVAIGYVDQQMPGNDGFLSLYHICDNHIELLQSDIPTPIFPIQGLFSQNGKWFVLGGFNQPGSSLPYNNVILYRLNF